MQEPTAFITAEETWFSDAINSIVDSCLANSLDIISKTLSDFN